MLTMRHLKLAGVLAFVAGLSFGAANAAPIESRDAVGDARMGQSPILFVRFVWHGHGYCLYKDGWKGPGWYRCGYSHRIGLGYGGPVGWHGWREEGARIEAAPGDTHMAPRPGGGSDHK